MTLTEKRDLLLAIQATMREVQVQAESLAGYVLALEAAGMDLPNMKQTAQNLSVIALGWEAGGDGVQ